MRFSNYQNKRALICLYLFMPFAVSNLSKISFYFKIPATFIVFNMMMRMWSFVNRVACELDLAHQIGTVNAN
jgi:hypothetical protein